MLISQKMLGLSVAEFFPKKIRKEWVLLDRALGFETLRVSDLLASEEKKNLTEIGVIEIDIGELEVRFIKQLNQVSKNQQSGGSP